MKAAVYRKYGTAEVLSIENVPKPQIDDDQVLVRVHATTMNRTDSGMRTANYFVSRFITGLLRPKKIVAGSEFAGEIVEVGANVSIFKLGDKVFGFEDVRSGAHAEYMAVRASGSIALMPEGRSYDEMAPAGEGATYAINIIRSAGVKEGDSVLVYGASGAIGTAAVQILKYLGVEVTAVCGTKNVELIKSIGTDRVISYETEDFTQTDDKFDLVFDAVGKSSYGATKELLKATGKYCSSELGKGGQNPLMAIWFGVIGTKKVIFPVPKINQEIMQYISQLVEVGAYKPVVDRVYQLDEIAAAAAYVETGQKTGNVVITIGT